MSGIVSVGWQGNAWPGHPMSRSGMRCSLRRYRILVDERGDNPLGRPDGSAEANSQPTFVCLLADQTARQMEFDWESDPLDDEE